MTNGLENKEEILRILQEIGFHDAEMLQKIIDTFLVARIMYDLGETYLQDSAYDSMRRYLTQAVERLTEENLTYDALGIDPAMPILQVILNQVYEQDTFPFKSFQRLNFQQTRIHVLMDRREKKFNTKELQNRLNWLYSLQIEENGQILTGEQINERFWNAVSNDIPKSIRPVENIHDAYDWFMKVRNLPLCASLKMDGINLRLYYLQGKFCGACTRGRNNAEVRDFTDVMTRIVPLELSEPYTGFIRTETYVIPSSLPYFRAKYNKGYVVPRTAINTVLSTPHSPTDYKYVKSFCFKGKDFSTLSESIDWAAHLGFDTPPKINTIWTGEIFDEFREWVMDLLTKMRAISDELDLKTDGLVVEIDNSIAAQEGVTDRMYNESNIALKFGPWEPGTYKAKLLDICIGRPETNIWYNCRGRIEPTVVESGITVDYINLYNLGLVVQSGIKKGDIITFKFKNDNASEWVYGV